MEGLPRDWRAYTIRTQSWKLRRINSDLLDMYYAFSLSLSGINKYGTFTSRDLLQGSLYTSRQRAESLFHQTAGGRSIAHGKFHCSSGNEVCTRGVTCFISTRDKSSDGCCCDPSGIEGEGKSNWDVVLDHPNPSTGTREREKLETFIHRVVLSLVISCCSLSLSVSL